MTDLRKKLLRDRPKLAERQRANAKKRAEAWDLRVLRDAAGLSQEQVAGASGLSLQSVQRLESLSGDLSSKDEIQKYRSACGKET